MSALHPDSDVLSLTEAIGIVRAGLNVIDWADPRFIPAVEQVVSALEYRLEQEKK
jgi:hypothetical protein